MVVVSVVRQRRSELSDIRGALEAATVVSIYVIDSIFYVFRNDYEKGASNIAKYDHNYV
jgi:hypothetical protein